jgi:hypothetical protein
MNMLNNAEQVAKGMAVDEEQKSSVHDSVISVANDDAVVKAALEGAAAVIHAQQPRYEKQSVVPTEQYQAPPLPVVHPPQQTGGPPKNNVNWTPIIIVGMILAAILVAFAIYSDISSRTLDDDGDGVANVNDRCSNTTSGDPVDSNGCAASQKDTDGDGVSDADDRCPGTTSGNEVDSEGCVHSTPGITLTGTILVLSVAAFVARRKS